MNLTRLRALVPGRAALRHLSWRPTVSALHVVVRRARADRPAVVAYTLLAVLVTLGALQAPLAFERAADAGLRRAVADAGSRADIVVTSPYQVSAWSPVAADDGTFLSPLLGVIGGVLREVPDGVRDVLQKPVAALHTSTLAFSTASGRFELAPTALVGERVTWVDGGAPGDLEAYDDGDLMHDPRAQPDDDPAMTADLKAKYAVPVGLSAATAEAVGLHVGDLVPSGRHHEVVVRVAGIFEPVDPGDPVWDAASELLDPHERDDRVVTGAVLFPTTGIRLLTADEEAGGVEVRAAVDLGALRSSDVDALRHSVHLLGEGSLSVGAAGVVNGGLSTDLAATLDGYAARHDVAMAQATTVLTGIAVLAAVVINQAAGMIAARRRTVLGLERARGSSIAAIAVRAALESLPVALVALVVAVLSTLPFGGPPAGPALVPVVVTLLATAAAPVLHAVGIARAAWSGRRVAANRRDRAKAARVRGSWRTAGEAAVAALAVAAVAATAVRGLGVGGDLLVAAAPVLAAFACTLLLARVVPVAMRAATRAASRRGSVVTLVGLSRTGRAGAVGVATVLLVVTTAAALAVYGGAAAATIASAPADAARLTVGADARIDDPKEDLVTAALTPHDGVTTAIGSVLGERSFAEGTGPDVTLLAVDTAAFPQFKALADATRAGLPKKGGAVPALIDGALGRAATLVQPSVWVVKDDVPLDVVGTVDLSATGPVLRLRGDPDDAPVVVVDRAAVAAASGVELTATSSSLPADVIWLRGPGTDAFAADLDAQALGGTVTTEAGLLQDMRTDPLTRGVTDLLHVTTWLVAVLALVAVVLALAGGGADRTRVLAVLRTLGVRRTAARGLTLTEFAPAAAVALVTGCAVGLVLAYTLVGGLELGTLVGGGATPRVLLAWWPFAVAVGAVVVAFTIGTVLAARAARHVRVGEVLRTW